MGTERLPSDDDGAKGGGEGGDEAAADAAAVETTATKDASDASAAAGPITTAVAAPTVAPMKAVVAEETKATTATEATVDHPASTPPERVTSAEAAVEANDANDNSDHGGVVRPPRGALTTPTSYAAAATPGSSGGRATKRKSLNSNDGEGGEGDEGGNQSPEKAAVDDDAATKNKRRRSGEGGGNDGGGSPALNNACQGEEEEEVTAAMATTTEKAADEARFFSPGPRAATPVLANGQRRVEAEAQGGKKDDNGNGKDGSRSDNGSGVHGDGDGGLERHHKAGGGGGDRRNDDEGGGVAPASLPRLQPSPAPPPSTPVRNAASPAASSDVDPTPNGDIRAEVFSSPPLSRDRRRRDHRSPGSDGGGGGVTDEDAPDGSGRDLTTSKRIRIPIFVDGWRSMRYPTHKQRDAPTTTIVQRQWRSRPTLRSLLRSPPSVDDDDQRPQVRSASWFDRRRSKWSVLLFPLGSDIGIAGDPERGADGGEHVAVFLERSAGEEEREVSVEFSIARPSSWRRSVSYDDDGGDIDGRRTTTFDHRYPGIRSIEDYASDEYESMQRGEIDMPPTKIDWGMTQAFHQKVVLDNISDGGYLELIVRIEDMEPFCSPYSHSSWNDDYDMDEEEYVYDDEYGYGYGDDGGGIDLGRRRQRRHHRHHRAPTPALGRLPRLRVPPAMEEAQRRRNRRRDRSFDDGHVIDDAAMTPPRRERGVGWRDDYDDTATTTAPRDVMAGLQNQGATCYMNSLLQVWFHLPAFRQLVLNLPIPSEDDDDDDDSSSVQSDSSASSTFSSCWTCPTCSDAKKDEAVGAHNDGKNDATKNGVCGTELQPAGVRDNSASTIDRVKPPTNAERRVGHALQCVFAQLSLASKKNAQQDYLGYNNRNPAVSTTTLTDAFGWDSASLFRQHDVQELSRVLLDKLENVFKYQRGLLRQKGAQSPSLHPANRPDLFEGKIQSYIRCTNVDYSSTKVETFLDIQLNVKGCPTLFDSLRQFIHEESLDGENQYDASDAGFGKQDAKKGVRLHTLPPVLNIHLKRFEFDMTTMAGMIKVHDRLEFPLELDMSDFVVTDETSDGGDNNGDNDRKNIYHLHSIIMHSGCVGGGHYMAYIRPKLASYDVPNDSVVGRRRDSEHQWFKFDDELVTPVKENDLLESAYGTRLSGHFVNGERKRSRLSLAPKYHVQKNYTRATQSATSAYMLAYIRESDLPWVLSGDSRMDAVSEATENADADVAKKEDNGEDQIPPLLLALLKNPSKLGANLTQKDESTRAFVTVPFVTDEQLAVADTLEGAYIPRFFELNTGKLKRAYNDFGAWFGNVSSTRDGLRKLAVETVKDEGHSQAHGSVDHVLHIRLQLGESGYGLLRHISQRLNVPMHRLRLWSTVLWDCGDFRVEHCITPEELLGNSVKNILITNLAWTTSKARSKHQGLECRSNRGTKITSKYSHGFYVEILPLDWTKGRETLECGVLVKPPSSQMSFDFINDADYPKEKYQDCAGQLCTNGTGGTDINQTKQVSPSQSKTPAMQVEDPFLGTHLSDNDMHSIYSSNVPVVTKESALVFFKQLVSSPENKGEGRKSNQVQKHLRFLGTALLRNDALPLSSLERCARKLLSASFAVDEAKKSPFHLFEVMRPTKLNVLSTPPDGSEDAKTLGGAKIRGGEIIAIVDGHDDMNTSVEHYDESCDDAKRQLLSNFRTDQIWLHALPLTVQDADLLKPLYISEEAAWNRDGKKGSGLKLTHSGVSFAVSPFDGFEDVSKTFYERFVRCDVVPSHKQIRFTRIAPSSLDCQRYGTFPDLSSRRGRPLAFSPPPPPQEFPINLNQGNVAQRIEALNLKDTRKAESEELEPLDASWLTSKWVDTTGAGRDKARHFYIYFDFPRYDWVDTALGKSSKRPVSALFAGTLVAGSTKVVSASSLLPLMDLIVSAPMDLRVRDFVCDLVGFDNGKARPGSPPSPPSSIPREQLLISENHLPLAMIVERSKIVRLLPFEENLQSCYPWNESVELPRGRVQRKGGGGSGTVYSLCSNDGSGRKRSRWAQGPLEWNFAALNGCVEKGKSTIVLECLPVDVLNSVIPCDTASTQPVSSPIDLVHSIVVGSNDRPRTILPSIVPIQVVFYIDGDGCEIPRFVPLLTYLREYEDMSVLRERICLRLYGQKRPLSPNNKTDLSSNATDSVPGEHGEESRGDFGSPLHWKARIISLEGSEEIEAHCDDNTNCEIVRGGAGTHGQKSELWTKLESKWPLAFKRGGGMYRLLRTLYGAHSQQEAADELRCTGTKNDLPTIGLAIPVPAFEDFVRSRASRVVGSAHHFRFDRDTGKLHGCIPVPIHGEKAADIAQDKEVHKNRKEGITIQ